MLKPQDVVVLLHLAQELDDKDRTFPKIAEALGISASEAHAAVRRATASGLVDSSRHARKSALLEFLVHGLRYVFPAEWRGVSRGIPTSYAAPPLSSHFAQADLPPVWPHAHGSVRGEALVPLYPSVPDAALRSTRLHEWLALVDAIRAGRARERHLAQVELERRLGG